MFCTRCGFECKKDEKFCPQCGSPIAPEVKNESTNDGNVNTAQQPVYAVNDNTVAAKWVPAFRSSLFLTICILTTAAAVFSLVTGMVDVIKVLFTVFLWLIYADAQRGTVTSNRLRCVSGTVCAVKVINWVLVGIFGFMGIATTVVFAVLGNAIPLNYITSLESQFDMFDGIGELLPYALKIGITGLALIIGILFIFIAVLIAVLNACGIASIHSLTKSMYKAIDANNFKCRKFSAAKGWLLAFGILDAISLAGKILHPMQLFAGACVAAVYIVLYVWLGKFFERKD